MIIVRAYILKDTEKKEHLLVIRTEDIDILRTIVKKLQRIRSAEIRRAADILDGDLNG